MIARVEDVDWTALNHARLSDALDALKDWAAQSDADRSSRRWREKRAPANAPPSALDLLVAGFGLTTFERALLLLAAGAELDPAVAALSAPSPPTFAFALGMLPEPEWAALAASAPLRAYRLVDAVRDAATSLIQAVARIDERVLHYLTGVTALDARLAGEVEILEPDAALVPTHDALATRIGAAWSDSGAPAAIALFGADETIRRGIAAAGAARAGLGLLAIDAPTIAALAHEELGNRLRLWEREAILMHSALFVDASAVDAADAAAASAVRRAAERLARPLVLATSARWRPLRRRTIPMEARKPPRAEQRALWSGGLAARDLRDDETVSRLVAQFDFGAHAIAGALDAAALAGGDPPLSERLWEAAREQTRQPLQDVAERIEAVATWDDLVLPERQREQLRDIGRHVAGQTTVYDDWDFAAPGSRGLGVTALFAGASGTGKTLAAEVLARELRLDLHRVDLASVMSKYIGETEKSLRRLFEGAESGGTILFFDEADALFGKRTTVKDSHDRYANVAIDYLLQRMESYRGLAVLATNMKSALDPAFVRRIRFIVDFPFPNETQRAHLWRRVFPSSAPLAPLDAERLARLSVAGGTIRNIALSAAFRAAERRAPIAPGDLRAAAHAELLKLERPIPVGFAETFGD
ncbi:MAG TPA: ATP-binding protein [Candidatus Limnocylindrales bacterium]|nr:ATP-binding protein [Candidatus Limnocylindrales bacterium]